MFALGCIIYECVIGQKLFASDMSVIMAYAIKKDDFFTERWPESPSNTPLHALGKLTKALIQVNPAQRPGAVAVQRWLGQILRDAYHETFAEDGVLQLATDEPLQVSQPRRPQVQSLFLGPKRKRDDFNVTRVGAYVFSHYVTWEPIN